MRSNDFDHIEYSYSEMLALKVSIFVSLPFVDPIGTILAHGLIKDQIWLECIESTFNFITFNHFLKLMTNIKS